MEVELWLLITTFPWFENIRHMRRKSRAFSTSALEGGLSLLTILTDKITLYSDTCMRTKKSAISYLVLASLM